MIIPAGIGREGQRVDRQGAARSGTAWAVYNSGSGSAGHCLERIGLA